MSLIETMEPMFIFILYVVRIIQILFHSAPVSTNPPVTGGHIISRVVTNLYCTFSMYFTHLQFWRGGSYLFFQFGQTGCFLLFSAFFYFCCLLLGIFFFFYCTCSFILSSQFCMICLNFSSSFLHVQFCILFLFLEGFSSLQSFLHCLFTLPSFFLNFFLTFCSLLF